MGGPCHLGAPISLASIASNDETNPGMNPTPLDLFHQSRPRAVDSSRQNSLRLDEGLLRAID